MLPRKLIYILSWTVYFLLRFSQVNTAGVFQFQVTSFRKNEVFHGCSALRPPVFNICVTQYNLNNTRHKCSRINIRPQKAAFNFPVDFTSQGNFSATLEAWHRSTCIPQKLSWDIILAPLPYLRKEFFGDKWYGQRYREHFTNARYAFRFMCDVNYYGPNCTEYCLPRSDMFGHYTCSQNGSRICLDGWTGDFCDKALCTERSCAREKTIMSCLVNPCMNDGTCVQKEDIDLCLCQPGFSGSSCEMVISDCDSSSCHNGKISNDTETNDCDSSSCHNEKIFKDMTIILGAIGLSFVTVSPFIIYRLIKLICRTRKRFNHEFPGDLQFRSFTRKHGFPYNPSSLAALSFMSSLKEKQMNNYVSMRSLTQDLIRENDYASIESLTAV